MPATAKRRIPTINAKSEKGAEKKQLNFVNLHLAVKIPRTPVTIHKRPAIKASS